MYIWPHQGSIALGLARNLLSQNRSTYPVGVCEIRASLRAYYTDTGQTESSSENYALFDKDKR